MPSWSVRGYRTEADLAAAYSVMQRGEIVIRGCRGAAYSVMQRGEIVIRGCRGDMDEAAVRSYLTV